MPAAAKAPRGPAKTLLTAPAVAVGRSPAYPQQRLTVTPIVKALKVIEHIGSCLIMWDVVAATFVAAVLAFLIYAGPPMNAFVVSRLVKRRAELAGMTSCGSWSRT